MRGHRGLPLLQVIVVFYAVFLLRAACFPCRESALREIACRPSRFSARVDAWERFADGFRFRLL